MKLESDAFSKAKKAVKMHWKIAHVKELLGKLLEFYDLSMLRRIRKARQ
jgi:hypothetical protein